MIEFRALERRAVSHTRCIWDISGSRERIALFLCTGNDFQALFVLGVETAGTSRKPISRAKEGPGRRDACLRSDRTSDPDLSFDFSLLTQADGQL